MTVNHIIFIILSSIFFYIPASCNKVELRGNTITPVLTPMKDNGDINLAEISRYAAYLHRNNLTTLWLFGTLGEPFSLNLDERKSILTTWCDENTKHHYGFIFLVGTAYMSMTDSCKFAAFCESLNVAAIIHKPPCDAGPSTPAQAASDMNDVAQCAPSTPISYLFESNFMRCNTPNIVDVVKLCMKNIPTFKFFIGPVEQILKVQAFIPGHKLRYIAFFYYGKRVANILGCDAHSTPFVNMFPKLVEAVNAPCYANTSLIAQEKLDTVASSLCNLEHCRIFCSVGVLKAAMEVKTGVCLGTTRKPLCPVTPCLKKEVAKLLKSLGE